MKRYFIISGSALVLIALAVFRLPNQASKSISAPVLIGETETSAESQKLGAVQNQKELFPVVRVIDGDTIVVNINGEQVHVRLIGINSPELNDKRPQVACFAERAKEEAQKLLDAKNIYLEKDPTQGDYDKYGRLLAYVFIDDGSTQLTTSGIFFNKVMIENGYAYEYTYRLPYKYQAEFKTAQQEARVAERGLWAKEMCSK